MHSTAKKSIQDISDWNDIQKIIIDLFGKTPDKENFYSPKDVDHAFLVKDVWIKIDPLSYTEEFLTFIYQNFNEVPNEVLEEREDTTTYLTFEKQEKVVVDSYGDDSSDDSESVGESVGEV